jgi:hypothetical protein
MSAAPHRRNVAGLAVALAVLVVAALGLLRAPGATPAPDGQSAWRIPQEVPSSPFAPERFLPGTGCPTVDDAGVQARPYFPPSPRNAPRVEPTAPPRARACPAGR